MELFFRHGGNLDAARRVWPAAPEPWLDLSTGINPRPYPAPPALRAQRARLPQGEDLAALCRAAAAMFGLHDHARILAVAGAESALRALPLLGLGTRIALDPNLYASHEAAWRSAGATIVDADEAADLRVLINPANPTGAVHDAASVRALADRQRWLVVDESFADADPACSVAGVAHPGLIVLRSFGKFFGLPGLRLGFAIADPALLARLRELFGDWPVGADAIATGTRAYRDRVWHDRTRQGLARQAARLDARLRRNGFEIVGGTSLFRLARAPDAGRRFQHLAERGILTRPFAGRPDWLRFGLPPAHGWRRLEAALEELR